MVGILTDKQVYRPYSLLGKSSTEKMESIYTIGRMLFTLHFIHSTTHWPLRRSFYNTMTLRRLHYKTRCWLWTYTLSRMHYTTQNKLYGAYMRTTGQFQALNLDTQTAYIVKMTLYECASQLWNCGQRHICLNVHPCQYPRRSLSLHRWKRTPGGRYTLGHPYV